jgi:hypothetical protein
MAKAKKRTTAKKQHPSFRDMDIVKPLVFLFTALCLVFFGLAVYKFV